MKWPLLWDHQLACSWAGSLSLHCQRSFSNSISPSPVLGQAVENLEKKKKKAELWKVMVKLWGPLSLSCSFGDCHRGPKTKQETKISSLRTNPHLQPQEPISQCYKALTQHNTNAVLWLGDLLHVLSESKGALMVKRPLVNPQDAREKNKFKVIAEWTAASQH